jgi:SSS family solute:Na+ symporter
MTILTLSTIILIVLVVAFIGMGLWFKRLVTTSEDFLLAGRSAPFWLMAAAYLGGYVGGASVSGYVGYGFNGGISQMWTSMFVVTGITVFIILFARRLNYFGRKTGAVTLADFVCYRYGEGLRLPMAIFSIPRPAFLTGMQVLSIAIVLNINFGWDIKYGVWLSAIIILLYMITAGQYSALISQWFQSILQSIGIVLFAIMVVKLFNSPTAAIDAVFDIMPEGSVSLWNVTFPVWSMWFLTLGLFYLVDPWIYMWAYIGTTPRTASNAQLAILGGSYYNVLPFIAGLALAAAGITGILTVPEGLKADALYAWFCMNNMPVFIGTIVVVGLLMTIVSCGSSFAMNGVTILTRDIYQKLINKNATDKQSLFASRVALVIIMFIGIASALWLPILVPLWVLAQAIGISGLFAPVMAAWFWKRATTAGALAASWGGGIVALAWAAWVWRTTGSPGSLVYGLHAGHVGLVVSLVLMIVVSLATKPEYEKALATSYKHMGDEMKANTPEIANEKGTGIFGWLGAHSGFVKSLWVIVGVLFIAHFILSFLFHMKGVALAMTWIAFGASIIMVFVLFFLGLKDVMNMVKTHKQATASKK